MVLLKQRLRIEKFEYAQGRIEESPSRQMPLGEYVRSEKERRQIRNANHHPKGQASTGGAGTGGRRQTGIAPSGKNGSMALFKKGEDSSCITMHIQGALYSCGEAVHQIGQLRLSTGLQGSSSVSPPAGRTSNKCLTKTFSTTTSHRTHRDYP